MKPAIIVPNSFVGWARIADGPYRRGLNGKWRAVTQNTDAEDVWQRLEARTRGMTVDLAVLPAGEWPRLVKTGDAGPQYRRGNEHTTG
jgi:hypothetical protein